jgi:hypothetical protein
MSSEFPLGADQQVALRLSGPLASAPAQVADTLGPVRLIQRTASLPIQLNSFHLDQ